MKSRHLELSLIHILIDEGCLKRVDEFLCTPEYEVRKDALYEKVSGILLDTFTKAKYDFVRYTEIDFKGTAKETADDILNILLEEQEIVKVAEDMYTLTEYMERAKELIQEHLKEDPVITLSLIHIYRACHGY